MAWLWRVAVGVDIEREKERKLVSGKGASQGDKKRECKVLFHWIRYLTLQLKREPRCGTPWLNLLYR